ncbi:unnamed protein product [Linum tenue]|uniref:GDSL esterase/lipase n=1 Tax=Linum tenue TaxID=586396 RepID=A0AAV0PW27_9ROSI|nr:unnamed protein product [Linum tenue]
MGSRRSFLRSWSSPLSLFVVVVALAASSADGFKAPRVPCYFIFGDSLYDSGNNNNLNTSVKVNYSPYGIDFPAGPTGRFSNGRTAADIIGETLGFKDFIPPFASNPDDRQILVGVNYASGSAGILVESGKQGRMYELGARKVALAGISNIGCTPSLIATVGTNGAPCVTSVNQLVAPFNIGLKSLISQLKSAHPDAKFGYLDTIRAGILASQVFAAFKVKTTPCCQVSTVTGLCLPNTVPCSQRRSYLFWDAFHPTELANRLGAPILFPVIQRIL